MAVCLLHVCGAFSEVRVTKGALPLMVLSNRLSSERATASPSESSAMTAAFMECLCFAILQKIDNEDDQGQIHQMLICDQVFSRST